ncbi:MAG: amino acid permease [Acidobacteria bacterium]|nr:amino acid permease [Acidobacteriota bacterium]
MKSRLDEKRGDGEGPVGLVRQLGFWRSVGIVVGITIGSGIFRAPASIADRVPDARAVLGVWILAGLITLSGSLSLAELSAAFPHTGGLYVYLREGWGRGVAFLFGWSQLVLLRASALGAMATVFAEYFLRSVGKNAGEGSQAVHYLAAGAIVFAALLNIRGTHWGASLVGITTVAKCGALVALVGASLLLGGARGATFNHFCSGAAAVKPGLFGLALISVLWAYDGWADLSFAGGEIENPQKNLPRALILGTLAIVATYVFANVAYLYVSPVDKVAQSPLVAADTMAVLFGNVGGTIVSVVVMISTFGALNAMMLAAPRVFFAMADDGLFFKALAKVHAKYRTPHVAIGLAACLGVAFVLARTFEQLADTFVLVIWPFYALVVAALYRLRRKRPDLQRPYRALGYPVLPLFFIAGVIYVIANALLTETLWTSVVFGIVLAGVPVYWLFFRRVS